MSNPFAPNPIVHSTDRTHGRNIDRVNSAMLRGSRFKRPEGPKDSASSIGLFYVLKPAPKTACAEFRQCGTCQAETRHSVVLDRNNVPEYRCDECASLKLSLAGERRQQEGKAKGWVDNARTWKAWLVAGRPPHPVYSPEAWRQVMYHQNIAQGIDVCPKCGYDAHCQCQTLASKPKPLSETRGYKPTPQAQACFAEPPEPKMAKGL